MDQQEEETLLMVMKMKFWVNVVVLIGIAFATKLVVQLWWRPKKITKHFSKQGVKGPPYNLFIGNMKELVDLMLKASSQPMSLSHHILPRVLPFYHHWKKIYGNSLSPNSFSPFFFSLICRFEYIRSQFISKERQIIKLCTSDRIITSCYYVLP